MSAARLRTPWLVLWLLLAAPSMVVGQEGHPHPTASSPQEHAEHATGTAFPPREASGTSWLPDDTPMFGIGQRTSAWQVMWHGNAFAQFLYESGKDDRGSQQAGSINWMMAMARRNVAGGQLGFRGMLSLEPMTIAGCGYPDLLATGETCNGAAIHDRQHPHDLFMEIAGEYNRPIRGALRWQVYAGLAGEPALGPVAYPHRLSAMPNPLAPISHHWLDATHITFGVVTAAVYNSRWKVEGSAFNGREPDEHRFNIDPAPLDSFSGRVWFAPTSRLVVQMSAGHLTEAEAGHDGDAPIDVTRVTASATYHRRLQGDGLWATTFAWGRNAEPDEASSIVLVESNLIMTERDSWFGRFEVGAKSAHDLGVHGPDELFTVAKLQAGYTRYLHSRRGLRPGFGGGLSLGFVPGSLGATYGNRVNPGFALFVTLRPDAHRM